MINVLIFLEQNITYAIFDYDKSLFSVCHLKFLVHSKRNIIAVDSAVARKIVERLAGKEDDFFLYNHLYNIYHVDDYLVETLQYYSTTFYIGNGLFVLSIDPKFYRLNYGLNYQQVILYNNKSIMIDRLVAYNVTSKMAVVETKSSTVTSLEPLELDSFSKDSQKTYGDDDVTALSFDHKLNHPVHIFMEDGKFNKFGESVDGSPILFYKKIVGILKENGKLHNIWLDRSSFFMKLVKSHTP